MPRIALLAGPVAGLGPIRGITLKPEWTLQCHSMNGAVNNTFVQFHPTLSVAKEEYTQSRVREIGVGVMKMKGRVWDTESEAYSR